MRAWRAPKLLQRARIVRRGQGPKPDRGRAPAVAAAGKRVVEITQPARRPARLERMLKALEEEGTDRTHARREPRRAEAAAEGEEGEAAAKGEAAEGAAEGETAEGAEGEASQKARRPRSGESAAAEGESRSRGSGRDAETPAEEEKKPVAEQSGAKRRRRDERGEHQSAGQVKELREKTGAGMMDCKKVLVEADGDSRGGAIDLLRERGLGKARGKAGRATRGPRSRSAWRSDGRSAALVEVNCETDFVAKTDDFGASAE